MGFPLIVIRREEKRHKHRHPRRTPYEDGGRGWSSEAKGGQGLQATPEAGLEQILHALLQRAWPCWRPWFQTSSLKEYISVALSLPGFVICYNSPRRLTQVLLRSSEKSQNAES